MGLMRSNVRQARAVQANVEKMVSSMGVEKEYVNEMEKVEAAGAIIEIPEQEKEEWTGPCHYVTHFPVLKPSSTSTQVRVVSNAKMVNAVSHLSFNDTLMEVPNALAKIYDVTLQWHGHEGPPCTTSVRPTSRSRRGP